VFIDARGLKDGARIEADLCIIGAGAAGIAIACELADGPHRVCLIESGGLEPDAATQALYEGQNVGWPYYDLDVLRLRYFGGTTNHWEGCCRPLEELDFFTRPWIPLSGWPFDKAELDPYYRRAQQVCQLGPYDYRVELWETSEGPRLPLDPTRVQTAMCQYSPPTRFGVTYRPQLERARNISVYLFANALDLVPAESGLALSEVRLATLEGTRFTASARQFVLATGGIENPRLLLAARNGQGLGNEHGLVGRYFMEHLCFPLGVLVIAPGAPSMRLYAERTVMPGGTTEAKGYLTLPQEVLKAERLPNLRIFLPQANEMETLRGTSPAVEAVFGLVRDFGHDSHTFLRLENVANGLDDIVAYGYRRLFDPAQLDARWLYCQMEQIPNAASRVSLGRERDAFNMPRVRLDWQITAQEREAFPRATRLVAEALGRIGAGRVRMIAVDPDTGWPTAYRGMRGGWHQMGTTRMSGDPKLGVVDADCKMHGFDNFYIAGSSVFPTVGYTNPTLTIVALALRIADKLKERLT
jgi:choline dehydrogenase-like flavoprotein